MELTLRSEPVALAEMEAWLLSIKVKVASRILQNLKTSTDHLDHYLEYAQVHGLPGAYVCCTFYQADLNETFTRMGLFMGAGRGLQAGTLVELNDSTYLNYKKLVAGHNLPSHSIREFYKSCPESKLNAHEREFAAAFTQMKSPSERFYLIGFSVQSTKAQKSVWSHEIHHAHYYLDESYRRAVDKFWADEVSAEDKIAMTREIGHAYNIEDPALVRDEAQAYLLQEGAENDMLKNFVAKYRTHLQLAIEQEEGKLS